MNIGIDVKCLSKRYTGIAVYVHEMLRFFNDLVDEKDNIYLFSNKNFDLDFNLKNNFHKVIYHSLSGSIGIMFQMKKYIQKYSIDIFWGTEHCIPLTTVTCKCVVTIHDLAILKIPNIGTFYNAFLQKTFTIRACNKADAIIAISKSTAKDVINIANVNKEKVKVIYNGDSPYNGNESSLTQEEQISIKNKYKLYNPYFLYFGTLEPRKNIPTIIKAYNIFKQKNASNFKLVLAGGLGWKYKTILEEIAKSPFKNDIIRIGYCSNKEKEYLYRHANSLVFTSLYEGFGFPILEAMSVGIPVITSNISSMPEIGGNLAFYLKNVYDENELYTLMEHVTQLSDAERTELNKKSQIWANKFSRKKCAINILKTFKKLINENVDNLQ